MAKIPTNPSQPHLPIFPTLVQLFSQHRNSSQSGAHPTKIVHSTTKVSPIKSISRTTSTNWKHQSQHKHKLEEEFLGKKTLGVHPNIDALCRPTTIFSQQPNGCGEPQEGLSISLSPMVQSQHNMRLSRWCSEAFHRAVCGLQAQSTKLD